MVTVTVEIDLVHVDDDDLLEELEARNLLPKDISELDDDELLDELSDRDLIPPDIKKQGEAAYYVMTGREPAEIRQLILGLAGKFS